MLKNVNVILIKPWNSSFIQIDLELLKRNFNLKVIHLHYK
jgi:hypothetical protein